MAVVRSPKDFVAGLMFIAIGIAAIVIASNYTLGTAARMGPGYFPRILGHPDDRPRRDPRAALAASSRVRRCPAGNGGPCIVVLGSVIVFGLIVNCAGPRAVDDRC